MIRNIIFDLGGVILNLDPAATQKAFESVGMPDFKEQYSTITQTGCFDDFDRGKISEKEFRDHLKKFLPDTITDEAIDKAWNAMLLDLPKERLELLKSLGKKYRLFLLSNTNEIHVTAFSAYLQKEYGFRDFSAYFERWYYSCRIGKRKPDAEIFEFVLNENGLLAEETLFIDDSPQHIEGAKKVGIKSYLLPAGKDICSAFGEKKEPAEKIDYREVIIGLTEGL
ncbi:MAG: HAD family phosphatase [Bacteroidota bacterium]|nr:HAD family phosphatase [Bacteroidota bacterium]